MQHIRVELDEHDAGAHAVDLMVYTVIVADNEDLVSHGPARVSVMMKIIVRLWRLFLGFGQPSARCQTPHSASASSQTE